MTDSSATTQPEQASENTAGEWMPIATAPRDGTWIQADIPGHGKDNVIFWLTGLLDSNDNECGGWSFATEQMPPDDWTDGICWEVNEDENRSTHPVKWMPLAPAAPSDSNTRK